MMSRCESRALCRSRGGEGSFSAVAAAVFVVFQAIASISFLYSHFKPCLSETDKAVAEPSCEREWRQSQS